VLGEAYRIWALAGWLEGGGYKEAGFTLDRMLLESREIYDWVL
jgi:hypothetical protein